MILDLKGKKAVLVPITPERHDDGWFGFICTAAKMKEAMALLSLFMEDFYDNVSIRTSGNDEVEGRKLVRIVLSEGDKDVAIGSMERKSVLVKKGSDERINVIMMCLADAQVHGDLIVELSDECDDYLPLNGPVAPYCECYHCGRQAEEHPSWVEQAEGHYNQGTGYEDNQAD